MIPMVLKLSFQDEDGKPMLKVNGDGILCSFKDPNVHFEVNGWATKMKNKQLEYQIELSSVRRQLKAIV